MTRATRATWLRIAVAMLTLTLAGCGACEDGNPIFNTAGYQGVCASPPEWLVQGPGGDGVNNAAILPDGSHYAIGWYGGTTSVFGPNNAADAADGGDSGWSPFVGHYAPDRSLRWVVYGRSASTGSPWNTGSVAACLDGGCVFEVAYRGDVEFKDATGAWHPVPAGNGYSIVVVRTDAQGNILWIQRMSSTGSNAFGFGCRCTADGSIYICGGTLRGGRFGNENDTNPQQVESTGSYCYLWKLDTHGNTVWVSGAHTASGSLHPYYNGYLQLKEDWQGGIVLAGMVPAGDLRFPDGEVLPGGGAGSGDVVVVRYNPVDGARTWAQRLRSETAGVRVVVAQLAPATRGETYLAIDFSGDVRLPDGSLLTRAAGYDAGQGSALIRMNGSTGTVAWTRMFRTASTSNELQISSIDSSPDGRVLLAGKFPEQSELVTLDGSAAERFLETFSGVDAFAGRFNDAGELAWLRTDGGEGYDHACNILVLPNGCVMVTGFSTDTATFGRGSLFERTLVSEGGWDGWAYIVSGSGRF